MIVIIIVIIIIIIMIIIIVIIIIIIIIIIATTIQNFSKSRLCVFGTRRARLPLRPATVTLRVSLGRCDLR